MNELIASTKDYLLSSTPGIIDYPNEHTESQLYRLASAIIRNILNSYVYVSNLIQTARKLSEEQLLMYALKRIFPNDWLAIAIKSEAHYFKTVPLYLDRYNLSLTTKTIDKINGVVEFLCYEIIESAIIEANFCALSNLQPRHLIKAIRSDPILEIILHRHQIYLIGQCRLNSQVLKLSTEWENKLSPKSIKLIVIYLELRVKQLVSQTNHSLTEENIKLFFKLY